MCGHLIDPQLWSVVDRRGLVVGVVLSCKAICIGVGLAIVIGGGGRSRGVMGVVFYFFSSHVEYLLWC